MIFLKLGVLWWKLKIFIANFSHVSPNRFWRIFSMLLKSHPTIKWRWKKFCCNYFDAKPQFDWTNITPTVYSNRRVSALSLGCGWSHRRQIKGHGNGTWISVGNIPFQTFRCSRKCAAGTTQIVSVSFISQVFRERFATGLQPELTEWPKMSYRQWYRKWTKVSYHGN